MSSHGIAELEVLDDPHLNLSIPGPATTMPGNGVRFLVVGNTLASVTATPDDFVQIPGQGFLGRAVSADDDELGYQIQLHFPVQPAPGSPPRIAMLPRRDPGGTAPLSADLTLTGGEREGALHLMAHERWTPDRNIPLPGTYTGQVVITVTAD